jgi:hypothetical protein
MNSLEQACLENGSNMVVIYMDDTTLSEILDVSQHSSGDQIIGKGTVKLGDGMVERPRHDFKQVKVQRNDYRLQKNENRNS